MRLSVILAMMLLFVGTSCSAEPVTRDATHQLVIGNQLCSGTYVADHTLLTATHCFAKSEGKQIQIDGNKTNVVRGISDGNDHILVVVTRKTDQFASLCLESVDQGDNIFYWGNAAGLYQMMRIGYASGMRGEDTIYDSNTWKGDSGAGIFTEKGCVTGVVSYITGDQQQHFIMMGSKPVKFTPMQWKAAGVSL